MKENYIEKSFFYETFETDIKSIACKWNRIFRKDIIRLLLQKKIIDVEINDLENLHKIIPIEFFHYDMKKGVNQLTIDFYETDEFFFEKYNNFLLELYEELGFDFYFQKIPTIRFHAPNVKNQMHYPLFHSDPLSYGHPPQEMNVWMSLTKNKNSCLG